jgi:hypothetical protein
MSVLSPPIHMDPKGIAEGHQYHEAALGQPCLGTLDVADRAKWCKWEVCVVTDRPTIVSISSFVTRTRSDASHCIVIPSCPIDGGEEYLLVDSA